MRSFILCTHPQISLGRSNQGEEVGRDVERMGQERKVHKNLEGKPEGKRPLGRPRRRWEEGAIMDLAGAE
jgi:hypothetical protein